MSQDQKRDTIVNPVSDDCDWYLQELIRLANKGLEVPLTLSCGGMLVSGILIGGRAFFREQSALMTEAFDSSGEAAEVMTKWVGGFGQIYEHDADVAEDEPQLPSARFVHLRNAKVFHPGQNPIPSSGPGVLWRGKVAAVDGFNWGVLGP